MNTSIIRHILGWIMAIEAAFMALPCAIAVIYGEETGWYFVWTALLELLLATPLLLIKPRSNVFFITFMVIFTLSVLCLSIEGRDLVTNFTAVAATINNIGPGLELVGPTGNFGMFSDFSKGVLIFDMLAGRLELFPMLVLPYPPTWKDTLRRRRGAERMTA